MNQVIQPIIESFKLGDFIVGIQTGDLTDEDSLQRARGGQGASIAWTMGHLLHNRYQTMNLAGSEQQSPYQAYAEEGAVDHGDYPSLTQLRSDWEETAAKLTNALDQVTDEQLLAIGQARGPHGEKRLLDVIGFFAWHEAYHIGQMGLIRAELGYVPTAEMATQVS